jgi:hypothetical protein
LTELLEIPQLLEACIHNELFDSALDVIQFARDTFQDQGTTTSETNFVIEALVRSRHVSLLVELSAIVSQSIGLSIGARGVPDDDAAAG